jgi:quercetin dioxygenase-like cupin family protein
MVDEEDKVWKVQVAELSEPCLITPEDAHRMRARVVVLGPGDEVGDHVTDMREELLVPLNGRLTVRTPDGEQDVAPGQALYIPEGMVHNVTNSTDTPIRYMYILALHRQYDGIKKKAHGHNEAHAHGKH